MHHILFQLKTTVAAHRVVFLAHFDALRFCLFPFVLFRWQKSVTKKNECSSISLYKLWTTFHRPQMHE